MAAFSALPRAPRSRPSWPSATEQILQCRLSLRRFSGLTSRRAHSFMHRKIRTLFRTTERENSRMRRRAVIAGLLALSFLGGSAHAQDNWPNGQIVKIVVPFAPGGTVDIVTRFLVQPLSEALKTA